MSEEEIRIEREIFDQFISKKANLGPVAPEPRRITNAEKAYKALSNYISSAPKFQNRDISNELSTRLSAYIAKSGKYPSTSILSSLGFTANVIKEYFKMPISFKPTGRIRATARGSTSRRGAVRKPVVRRMVARRSYAARPSYRRTLYRKPRYLSYKRKYVRRYRRRRY